MWWLFLSLWLDGPHRPLYGWLLLTTFLVLTAGTGLVTLVAKDGGVAGESLPLLLPLLGMMYIGAVIAPIFLLFLL